MNLEKIKQHFNDKHLTLGATESFTGGLFASTVTSIPGASTFFKGSIVTYATEEKINILKVPTDIIDRFGVVSKEVAAYMASHGRDILNVDVCVSFTGNAGPSALENKPVGEIYIGVSTKESVQVYCLNIKGDRKYIQSEAVKIALNELEKY